MRLLALGSMPVAEGLSTKLIYDKTPIGVCTLCVAQYLTDHPFELVLPQVRRHVVRKL